jgi:hypothetical protein
MRRTVLTITVAATLGVACGTATAVFPTEPSAHSAERTPTANRSGNAAAPLTTGRARVLLDGDLHGLHAFGELTVPVLYSPPGGVTLTWRSEAFESFTISGPTVLGPQPTSDATTLQFSIVSGPELLAFTSQRGECTITVDREDTAAFAGSFDCAGVQGSGPIVVDASGTFEASG